MGCRLGPDRTCAGAFMIVVIDTSGQVCVVAGVVDDQVVFTASGRNPRSHAEELAPLIRDVLQVAPLDRVVVGRGPGSFTGLRVGLVTARVLGWARSVPVSGICSLDVVAAQNALVDGYALVDARRAELFWASYRGGVRVSGPHVASREEVRRVIGSERVVGDVALLSSTDRREFGSTVISAQWLGSVARSAVASATMEPPTALYLRHPDITMSPAGHGPEGRTSA